MFAHIFQRQSIDTGLPSRSTVARLAMVLPMVRSLVAPAPAHDSTSQVDCQPPSVLCDLLDVSFSRASSASVNSAFIAAASGTSTSRIGVEKAGIVSKAIGTLSPFGRRRHSQETGSAFRARVAPSFQDRTRSVHEESVRG